MHRISTHVCLLASTSLHGTCPVHVYITSVGVGHWDGSFKGFSQRINVCGVDDCRVSSSIEGPQKGQLIMGSDLFSLYMARQYVF